MGERVRVTSREVVGVCTLVLSAWFGALVFLVAYASADPRRGASWAALAVRAFAVGLVPALALAGAWGLAVWAAGRRWPRLRGRWPLLCAGAMAALLSLAAAGGAYAVYTEHPLPLGVD
jgi:hypothetical protein